MTIKPKATTTMQLTPRMIAQPKPKIAIADPPYDCATQTRWNLLSIPSNMAITVAGTRTYQIGTGKPIDSDNDLRVNSLE
jgi:hypothetical protein